MVRLYVLTEDPLKASLKVVTVPVHVGWLQMRATGLCKVLPVTYGKRRQSKLAKESNAMSLALESVVPLGPLPGTFFALIVVAGTL